MLERRESAIVGWMDTLPTPPEEPKQAVVTVESSEDADRKDIELNKDIAAFSYLWIMSVVVFFLRRKSPFVRFHAKQAMVLFALSLVVMIVPVISRLLVLCVLGLMVYGLVNAAQGQRKDVPIVGPLSRGEITIRQAWKQIVDVIAVFANMVRLLIKKFKKQPPSSSPSQPS